MPIVFIHGVNVREDAKYMRETKQRNEHFADLSMFPGLGNDRPFCKPPGVRRWINVYDSNDVFAFAAQPLFSSVEDRPYASGKMGVTTHADCFKFISLYEHIARAIIPHISVR